MANDLNILYQNVRGLRSKTNIFYRNLINIDCDMVCLSETWLNDSVFDYEVFDTRYTVYRNDRDYASRGDKLGGGVLIAVRSHLRVHSSSTIKLSNPVAEVVRVSISLHLSPSSRFCIFTVVIFLMENTIMNHCVNFMNWYLRISYTILTTIF